MSDVSWYLVRRQGPNSGREMVLDMVGVGLVERWEEPWGSLLVLLFPPKAVFVLTFHRIFRRQFLGVTVDRWNAHFRRFWGNFWSVRSLFLILNLFGLQCRTKHGTTPLVHVREIECLTGREPTKNRQTQKDQFLLIVSVCFCCSVLH